MHMSDALLSPTIGGIFWAGTIGVIAYASKKIRKDMDDYIIPLMGVLGAFVFAGQMINFTIPATGSSGHISGGMLLSILLGPYAAFLVMASVLTVQSLFFADGGLLALGSNIWNLGFYPCLIGYPIYKAITKTGQSTKRLVIACLISVIISSELGAFSVVVQTKLSGITELPFSTFLILMLSIHLPISVIEGVITAGIVNYIKILRPDIIRGMKIEEPPKYSIKRLLVTLGIFSIIIGGIISLYASTNPDGLEWSIERIYGSPEIPERQNPITDKLSSFQENTSFMPDYSLPKDGASEVPPHFTFIPETSVAGIIGSFIVFSLLLIVGLLTKIKKKGHF